MDRKETKFTIGLNGEIKFEAMNMKGESCKVATSDLEAALRKGGLVESGKGDKPEIYEHEEVLSLSNDAWV